MTDQPLALHPWNHDFEWTAAPHLGGVLTAEQVEQFDRAGFCVLADLLTGAELATVRAEIDRFEAEVDEAMRAAPGERLFIAERGAITFSVHLVARSPLLRRLTHHPRLVGACADLVGPDVNLYWDQAVYKKPEKPRRFPWHQDNGYAFVEPQQYLTCWIALTDATEHNGCPWVAPGLHRLGTLAHRYVDPLGWECLDSPADAVPVEVAAGSAVLFSSLTPHLTGPNTTDHVRRAYIVQYAPTGAEVLHGDPAVGPPTGRTTAAHPDRQYPVLRGGLAVAM